MYRILVIAIVLLAIFQTWRRHRGGLISLRRFLAWTGVWLVVFVFGMVPQWSDLLSRFMGIERGADLFLFFGILLVGYLVLSLYLHVQSLERKITELVRALALRDMDGAANPDRDTEHDPPGE